MEVLVGEVPVDAARERLGRGGKVSPCRARADRHELSLWGHGDAIRFGSRVAAQVDARTLPLGHDATSITAAAARSRRPSWFAVRANNA
jgi:hypothetical protein